jgi:eukaryotic-like serine/threonine-protein kinase
VYEAVQAPMDRKVALKLIPSSDPTAAARFEREAYTISKLSHPNTVTLYDFGQANDGYLYLAMEHLTGQTLTDEIRASGPLGPERTVHIANQICRSLGEAHRMGIIHRDVKPDNMFLISVDTDHDYVKVLDFGIAKAVAGEEDVSLTADGRIIGTPRYMSPEQILAQPVDHRADIYSLGCIIFEMLCGGPPFEQNSTAALMMSHAQQPPPSFAERLTEDQLRAIPHGLENVVRRAMAKNPAQRPQTTDDLRKELEQALRIHSAYATGQMAGVGTGERPSYPTPAGFGPPSGSYPSPTGGYQQPGQGTGNYNNTGGYQQPGQGTGNYSQTGGFTGQRVAPQYPGQNPTGNFEHHTGDHPRQTGSYARPSDSGNHTGQHASPTGKGKAVLLVVVLLCLGVLGVVGYKLVDTPTEEPRVANLANEPVKAAKPDTEAVVVKEPVEEGAPADANMVEIVLTSKPAGATIMLGAVEVGQTPKTFKMSRTGGSSTYTLVMDGYEDAEQELNPHLDLREYTVPLEKTRIKKTRPVNTGSKRPPEKVEVKPEPVEPTPAEVKTVKPKVDRLGDDKPKVVVPRLD